MSKATITNITTEEIGDNEFKCANCQNVYEKSRSDEECREEFDENFPLDSIDDICIVCDECYTMMMGGKR